MKGASTLHDRCLALMIGICLAMAMLTAIPAAYAVVKNVTIVDAQGNSLANTKVTIVFPDGTEVEEETDDDGMLVYDFPGDGDYTVNYPGGQMAVSVSGGIPTWVWVAGGVAAAGITYAIVDNNNDSNNPGSGGSSSPPPSGGGGSPPPSGGTCTAGMLNVTATVNNNPESHPNEFNGIYDVACSGSNATIATFSVGSFNVTWNCTVDSSGTCNAAATDCSYAGFSTTCSLTSTFDSSGWSGQMSAGDDNALPMSGGSPPSGGQPILVDFTGS